MWVRLQDCSTMRFGVAVDIGAGISGVRGGGGHQFRTVLGGYRGEQAIRYGRELALRRILDSTSGAGKGRGRRCRTV